MTAPRELCKQRIESVLRECDAHRVRIASCMGHLAPLFPLDVARFSCLGDEAVAHVDQMLYRFGKMQDAMGRRLFPQLYGWLEEDPEPRPFADILDRLEKWNVVDAELWRVFRGLRNSVAHDYPEAVTETVAALNVLYREMPCFLGLYEVARGFFLRRKEHGGTPSP